MRIHAKRLQGPDGWLRDQVLTLEQGRIAGVCSGDSGDLSGAYLTAGLFDQHHHGALGFDAIDPDLEKARQWLRFLAGQGVLGVLLTLGTASREMTRRGLRFARRLMEEQRQGGLPGALVQGVHLEGPFINPQRSGAMNRSCILSPDVRAYDELSSGFKDIIRVVTLAPELPGALELARHIIQDGTRVQAGHSDATFLQARAAFDAGIDGVTHTFNAIRPIHQREGGILAAALLDAAVTCEVICDGVHVSDELLRLLAKVKTPARVSLVSDSTPSAGLPDGEYYYANHPVIVREGRNYTESGGIAGSTSQAGVGVRHLVSLGMDRFDVIRMASLTPHERLGLPSAIHVGERASLVLWDEGFHPIVSFLGDQFFRGDRVV